MAAPRVTQYVLAAGEPGHPARWIPDGIEDASVKRQWHTDVICIKEGASPEEVGAASRLLRGVIRRETGRRDFFALSLLSAEVGDAVTEALVGKTTAADRTGKRAEISSDAGLDVLKRKLPPLYYVTAGYEEMATKPQIKLTDNPALFVYGANVQGLPAHTDNQREMPATMMNQLVKTVGRGGQTNIFLVCEKAQTLTLLVADGGVVATFDQSSLHSIAHGVTPSSHHQATIMLRSAVGTEEKALAHQLVTLAAQTAGANIATAKLLGTVGSPAAAQQPATSAGPAQLPSRGPGVFSTAERLGGLLARRVGHASRKAPTIVVTASAIGSDRTLTFVLGQVIRTCGAGAPCVCVRRRDAQQACV